MTSRNINDIDKDRKRIVQIAKGNQLVFKEIFNLYYVRIFHFAKKYLRSEHLAEDAVQDIFLKLWEKKEELIQVEDFSSWLFLLTRNHVLNILKRASTESRIKEEIKKTIETSDEQLDEKQIFEKERFNLLQKIITMLPSQRQEVFRLCRFEEKSYEETAQLMGISKSTVNDHMVKAMKYLKSNLAGKTY